MNTDTPTLRGVSASADSVEDTVQVYATLGASDDMKVRTDASLLR